MSKVDWKTNEKLAVGKGATVQEFFTLTSTGSTAPCDISLHPSCRFVYSYFV